LVPPLEYGSAVDGNFAKADTAATSPTRGSSCTHVESVPPPAAAPDSPGRVTGLINAIGGLIGGALSPSRAAPADEIGASPFNQSNADSTISGSGDNVEQSNETDDSNIARSAAEHYAEDRTDDWQEIHNNNQIRRGEDR